MKNFLILISSILLFGCSSNSQPYINLNPIEFQAAIENEGGIILDVRTPQEVSSGTIENASTIDFYDQDFEKKSVKFKKTKLSMFIVRVEVEVLRLPNCCSTLDKLKSSI
ncbi:rhodanese-like domain-containing protein [Flavobacteriales bacterium]|nr:rhodanese-like domain-containing protein [Flavobacteriales bacterium]